MTPTTPGRAGDDREIGEQQEEDPGETRRWEDEKESDDDR